MISVSSSVAIGDVKALVSTGRGHSPEELTELALNKIISVADTAPQPIRDQALAFRERVRAVLLHYLAQAARSERTTLYNRLREAGFPDAADAILKL